MHDGRVEREIGVFDVLSVLWRGKLILAFTTGAALLLAGIIYFAVPRNYESVLDIEPIRQADLSNYRGLIAAELFPYDRASLFSEFLSYVRNTDLLIPVALETGIVKGGIANEALDRRDALSFVQSIEFSRPRENEQIMRMRVRGGDDQALDKFVTAALDRANARFAERIRFELLQRLASDEEQRQWQIEKLDTQIDARRLTAESKRQDRIDILRRQAEIARLLNLDKPVAVASAGATPAGEAVSVQVNSADQPDFMQGYLAIEEQIRQLEQLADQDPYVEGLRQLEQDIYLLRNNPDYKFRQRLLETSALNKPQDARLVQYDLIRAAARKIFPRVTVFGPTALILGFSLGVMIVLWRARQKTQAL